MYRGTSDSLRAEAERLRELLADLEAFTEPVHVARRRTLFWFGGLVGVGVVLVFVAMASHRRLVGRIATCRVDQANLAVELHHHAIAAAAASEAAGRTRARLAVADMVRHNEWGLRAPSCCTGSTCQSKVQP